IITSVEIPQSYGSSALYGVSVSGIHAVVSGESAGLTVLDVSNPVSPVILGSVYALGRNVVASGSHAYVVGQLGVSTVDFSNPTSPPMHELWGPGGSDNESIAISGTRAFMAAKDGGIQIADISAPETPSLIGGLSLPAVMNIAVS